MFDFIKTEEWGDEYWCLTENCSIELSSLSILNYNTSYKKPVSHIQIRIKDYGILDKPTTRQIEALKFIIEKQEEIIQNIFYYYQKVILPVYQNATDVEETEIANSKNELNTVFGISSIEIPEIDDHTSIHFLFDFDFKYDDEHGLKILFHKSKPVDFFEIGCESFEAIELFDKGFIYKKDEQLIFELFKLNGELIFRNKLYFDEQIELLLKSGTYRMFIPINENRICRNFYLPIDLTKFSMKELLTY